MVIIPNPPGTERSPHLPPSASASTLAKAPTADARTLLALHQQQDFPPLRCTPSLQAPQGPLVDFLTGGYGYDDQSVAAAVQQGNAHFEKRELPKALDYFGAAYEIGRLHFDYKPLMHDLVVRRILCFSMMGDLQQALHEHELALRVVPHSATALLLAGMIYSKLGDADNANQSFQRAVAQCRELRDLIDCVVATFMLAQGHCDRAIQICSQVLTRQPKYAFALLVRGDAYKFHASGYFARQAADDYTALLEIDPSLQALSGERITQQQHSRIDELVLCFHPRLKAEGPRSYDQYPMCAVYRKRRPFLVVAFVLFATAKLKTCVRSTQLVQNVQQRNEELLQARAAAERKVRQLADTQQRLASVESSSFCEVWGPADPDHVHVRKYRRYWMERPLGFPKRELGKDDSPPGSRSPSPPKRTYELPKDPAMFGHGGQQQPLPPPITSPGRSPLPPEHVPALLFAQPDDGSGRSGGPPGASAGALRRIQVAPTEAAKSSAFSGEMAAADLLLASEEPSTPPHPTAQKLSTERTYLVKPPPQKLGHDWNEQQWLAKALELADAFDSGTQSRVDQKLPMTLAMREGQTAADVASKMLRPHAEEPTPGQKNAASPVKSLPPSLAVLRVPGPGSATREVNLTDAMVEFGFDAIPDWFTAVDRIYELSEMEAFRNEPESLAATPGLAGAPGYSYVVHRAPRREREQKSPGRSAFVPGHEVVGEPDPDEVIERRYRDRLLAASAPGPTTAAAR